MEQSWTTEQLRGTPPKYTLLGAKLHLITPPCPSTYSCWTRLPSTVEWG